MSSNAEDETDPGIAAKVEKATKRVDPWADDLLDAVKGSAWTPWWLAGAAVALIAFGMWAAW